MMRNLESEWLDELPAKDPRALQSRRDMQRINTLMRQARIMQRVLSRTRGQFAPRVLLELGAGDGTFMLKLARSLAVNWKNVKVLLLDRLNIVSDKTREGFVDLGWSVETITADASDYLEGTTHPVIDVIAANLFLHHLERIKLTRLFQQAARIADLLVACEPRRSALALAGSKLLWAIGCNEVTRHDSVVSVRAGFAGQELSMLWPEQAKWRLQEQAEGLFTHSFVAQRLRERQGAEK